MQTITYTNSALRPSYSMVSAKQCGSKISTDPIMIGGLVKKCDPCREVSDFTLKVFNTDKSSFLFYVLGTATVTLLKQVAGVWQTVAGSFGTVYPKGFMPNEPFYQGVIIDWQTVFTNFGKGLYKLNIAIGGNDYQSYKYNCDQYDCDLANKTVYLECKMPKGYLGDTTNQQNQINFSGYDWIEYHRIPAVIVSEENNTDKITYFVGKKAVVTEINAHSVTNTMKFKLITNPMPVDYSNFLLLVTQFSVKLTEDHVKAFSEKYKKFDCMAESGSVNFTENEILQGANLRQLTLNLMPIYVNQMNLNV